MTAAQTQKFALLAVVFAGFAGACGIALAAAGAHVSPSPLLTTAADFLLTHAAATLALAGLAVAVPRRGGAFLVAAAIMLLGCLFFCGDLSLVALTGERLFPMAAPIGGSLLILGWGAVVAAGIAGFLRERR